MTVQEIYSSTIQDLSPAERLRLAALILDDLSAAAMPLDVSDAWSEEDIHDVMAYSLRALAPFPASGAKRLGNAP